MLVPTDVKIVENPRHEVLIYDWSLGISDIITKIGEGVETVVVPETFFTKREKKELLKVFPNLTVNTLEINYYPDHVTCKIFQALKSYRFSVRLSQFIKSKLAYRQVNKRILESPILWLTIYKLKSESKDQRRRLMSFSSYLATIDFTEFEIKIHADTANNYNFKQYKRFFEKICPTKVSIFDGQEDRKTLSTHYRQFFHPVIICNLKVLEISLNLCNFRDFKLLPLHLLKGHLKIYSNKSYDYSLVDIAEVLILLLFRVQNFTFENNNERVSFYLSSVPRECLVKFMLSSKHVDRNISDIMKHFTFKVSDLSLPELIKKV